MAGPIQSALTAKPARLTERRLTIFGRDFIIRVFEVSRDGREIVFDRVQENSDIVVIDRLHR